MSAFGRGGSCSVSITAGPACQFRALSFVQRAHAALAVEGVGCACRTSYWASSDETGLLALRLGAKFRLALNRSIGVLIGAPTGDALKKTLGEKNGLML